MSLLPANIVEDTFGATLVGAMLSCVSLGVLLVAGWTYFSRFPEDRRVYKALAGYMVVAGIVDTGVNCHFVYDTLINHFGVELWILYTSWTFASTLVLIGLTCAILQCFMSYRVWVVSERRWVGYPACSVALAVVGAGISIWLAVWYQQQTLTLTFANGRTRTLMWSWFAVDTLSELMSTLALNYFLVIKPRTRFFTSNSGATAVRLPTRHLLTRLARRAVETNVLSLAVHLAVGVLYLEGGKVYYWYSAPAFMIVKVYGISLLVTFNARAGEDASFSQGSGAGARSDLGRFSADRAGAKSRSRGEAFGLTERAHVSRLAEEGEGVDAPGSSLGRTHALAFPPPAASEVSAASGVGGQDPEKAGLASFDGDEVKVEVRVGWA